MLDGPPRSSVLSLADQIRADGKHVHASALEAVDGVTGCAHNRLIFVEAGVQDYRNTCFALASLDSIVVERIFVSADALQATGIVHVVHCAELCPFCRPDL